MPGLKLWGERQLSRMKQDMDRMFEALCTDFGLPPASPLGDAGLCLSRTRSHVVVSAAVPNLSPEDFSVSIKGRHLVIAGHSTQTTGEGIRTTHTIRRELYLPCSVDESKVTASYVNGVVEVLLPLCAANGFPNGELNGRSDEKNDRKRP